MNLSKRQKIIIATTIISLGLLFTQNSNFLFMRYRLVLGLLILTDLFTLWVLWDHISKLKAIILLILPTMFTLGVSSFYFLLPIRWLTRLPVLMIFAFSLYSLLLAQNVFNVASQRTIPLYRAAFTAAFLFTLVTAFFIFNVVFALRLQFYWNGITVALISFPLILQLLWVVQMDRLSYQIIIYSFILSLVLGELAISLSFFPIATTMWSLILSTALYVTLGIITQFLKEKLTSKIAIEYAGVGLLVVTLTFFSISFIVI